jgi:hypothetical protein
MTKLTTLTQIHKLEERYPFNEEELEILIRCHDQIRDETSQDDFLTKMAFSSPYTYFFLPGDEMRDRVSWLEDHVLPMGFSNKLRAAISADPFVTYANEGEGKDLERFLEGVADTGRRGTKEALHIIYEIIGEEPAAEELLDLCFRLAIASDAMQMPNLEKESLLKKVASVDVYIMPLAVSLMNTCEKDGIITQTIFVNWAEYTCPMLSSTLSSFMHHLIFRGRPYPAARVPYSHPKLYDSSDIFMSSDSPLLFFLSVTSRHFSGKVGYH